MDYEAAMIAKVVLEKKVLEAVDQGVKEELFLTHRLEWKYVMDFFRTHGAAPPQEEVVRRFPELILSNFDAPLSYLLEELQDRRVHGILAHAMKEAAPLLNKKEPQKALEIFRRAILTAEIETRSSKDVNVCEDPMRRLNEYQQIAECGGITGLPSPWPCLDDATLGFQPEELWMVVARGGIGKTWCEVVGSRFHWVMGYTPLLFSKEMSIGQMIKRFDAAHARISHKRLRAGQLTSEEYARYEQTLRSMKETSPFWISADDVGSGGISGIRAKVKRYKPKVVWIDGLYLIEDERGGNAGWERLKNVAGDLKSMARQEGIPVIVSHQFNKDAGEEGGTADTLAYGDVQKWCDGILGMYQNEELRLSKEMLFKLLKHREGDRLEFVSQWDLDNMQFDPKPGAFDGEGVEEGQEDTINF